MVGQAIGSMLYAFFICINGFIPDVAIDTMGIPFAYPLLKLIFGCKVIAYIHYPTISTDMLKMVKERKESYNNNSTLSKSRFRSVLKLIYYHIFASCYSLCGFMTDVVMCNSSWTKNHIESLWHLKFRISSC